MEETQKFSLNLPRLPVKRGFSWSRPQALVGYINTLRVARRGPSAARPEEHIGDAYYTKPRREIAWV